MDADLRQTPTEQSKESPVENKVQQPSAGQTEPGSNVKFLLVKLNVTPSEILTSAEIAAITSKYEGHEITLADVNTAVQEINQLYAKKEHIVAKALLLPQKITDGIVNIKLVESHVGKYRVEGSKYTSAQYFTQRMALKEGGLLKLDQLEQDVIRFNKTNGSQLRVVLVKGEAFGTTDIVIKAVEQSKQQGVLFSDNAGSESTGKYRTGAMWTLNSLHGGGDSLTLNTTYAKGATGGGISYQAPIDYMGTQVGVSYSKNQTNIVSGVFQSLQVAGDSTDLSVSVNHPFKTTLDSKQTLFGELHKKTSDTTYSGAKLTAVTVKSAVLGWAEQKYYNDGMRYQRIDVTSGFGYNNGQGFEASRQVFNKANYSYASRIADGKKGVFLLRASGQLNLKEQQNLPSTEQFNLGGFSTVRGFSEGAINGDSGYFVSGEYHFPVGKVEGVLFLDHGGAFSYNGEITPNTRDNYLTGAGLGIISNIGKNTSLQVFWGVPIDFIVEKGNKANGSHWHFYLQHSL